MAISISDTDQVCTLIRYIRNAGHVGLKMPPLQIAGFLNCSHKQAIRLARGLAKAGYLKGGRVPWTVFC